MRENRALTNRLTSRSGSIDVPLSIVYSMVAISNDMNWIGYQVFHDSGTSDDEYHLQHHTSFTSKLACGSFNQLITQRLSSEMAYISHRLIAGDNAIQHFGA